MEGRELEADDHLGRVARAGGGKGRRQQGEDDDEEQGRAASGHGTSG